MNIFTQTRENLLKRLNKGSITLIHSGFLKHKTQDQFYPFQVEKNFYYLTGIKEKEMTLCLIKTEEKTISYLFLEETTDFMRKWVGENMSKKEASSISGINESNIMYNSQFDGFFKALMSASDYYQVGTLNQLYLDLFRIDKNTKPLSLSTFDRIVKNYQELQLKDVLPHLTYLRMFKNKDEIVEIKKSIEITKQGLNRIMRELPKRKNEHEIEADFVHEITLNGSRGVAFDTILASGVNGCVLHYEDNNSALNQGELLLCDLGAIGNEHGADISRTYPIDGRYSDRQREIYEIVLKCNKECIEYIKPGITLRELHKKSLDVLKRECMKIGLIKEESDITKYYYHNVTHFLGLDTHDVGIANVKLEEGMVLTVEPGLYIKEEKIGIRIEDDILVTSDGCENLSKDIIKEIEDIEKYMKA